MTATAQQRFLAIDILRATTMFFMIFVNDTWTLTDIPHWIEHVAADADGMGFADVIFPLFLFIVGLSLPYAIDSKRAKGEKAASILWHIASRTFALLSMGFFLVNQENYSPNAYLHKSWWTSLLILAFFLIWRVYPKGNKAVIWYKLIGVSLLIALVFLYENIDGQRGLTAMGIHWWGILGLIGWGYFTAALVYFLAKGRLLPILLAIALLLAINIGTHLHIMQAFAGIQPYFWFAGDGAMGLFCLFGVLSTLLYRELQEKVSARYVSFLALASLLLIAGFATRPLWGISKIQSTPSWVLICSGIAVCMFALAIAIAKSKAALKWHAAIRPAGSSTLTCYLVPYVFYALMGAAYTQLPAILTTGLVGIAKSLLFAYLIIQITAALEKKSWKLKI
ncbi:DUF5009 domain-containing protein [Sphingobacterium bambusae]|uniref:DUF5009 domain-containing protein n=1 Tax=Sphingobacterium bambusae TaxID=662858 RepID=A0ABW6BEG6_9SPHI|nr:DUF5009 domain-containing protein [Sphingobacterium bambusae]WPL47007.1 DUF5009 domain-containing protein [Sphingobacterium bambusae]